MALPYLNGYNFRKNEAAMEADHGSAQAYALLRLEQELPPRFVYHSITHTRDEVMVAAERFALREGLPFEARMLLQTAATFHDLGYIVEPVNHEFVSAAIATQVLPSFGYMNEQISCICGMIRATHLLLEPHTHLEQLLVDADLDVLGRAEFLARNAALREEMASERWPLSDVAWFEHQVAFVANHRYWTTAAHELRDAQKQHNLLKLRALLQRAQERKKVVPRTLRQRFLGSLRRA